MSAPATEVLILAGGVELSRHTLGPGAYTLGRSSGCHIQVAVDGVSREHARLTIEPDGVLVLEDLGSSHGTFLDGQLLTAPIPVAHGQAMQIGDAVLEARAPGARAGDSSAEAVRRLLPEAVLGDRKYSVGDEVARGGMGAIYGARDAAIHRSVAMKVMLDSRGEADARRFIEEAQITGQLEHPGIVPIYELGVDAAGQPFYTMKMVRGITLKKVLALLRDGVPETVEKYSPGALLTIFQKICDALAFAHSRGVLHRDLKPENIMVGEFGEVMVMDWGLAKVLGGREGSPSVPGVPPPRTIFSVRQSDTTFATADGSIMGTPQYMSPEQARGEIATLDARSDIYALGAILYAMLTLRPPVTGANVAEVVDKVARGEVEPLIGRAASPRVPKLSGGGARKSQGTLGEAALPGKATTSHLPDGRIPASLAAVVRKAMAFDPAARYPSVAALQADLAAFQGGFATAAENAGAWKQLTLLVKRHKATTIGLAAVLLVGATFGTKALVEGRRAEREAVRANQALADLKKSAPSLLALAASEAAVQHFDSALEKLDAALAIDPALHDARWRRATVLVAQRRFSEAIAALDLARAHDPQRATRADIEHTLRALAAQPSLAGMEWRSGNAVALTGWLNHLGASGELLAVSSWLKTDALAKQKVIQERLRAWLGEDNGTKTEINAEGLLSVTTLPKAVQDLTPLRGLPIDLLSLVGTDVTSLEPLRGMQLVELTYVHCSDLSPLVGMPLRKFASNNASRMTDLSPLRGAPLTDLQLYVCGATDFSPLSEAPLVKVALRSSNASSLEFLRNAPVTNLNVSGSKGIRDLSPLRGKRLVSLTIGQCPVSDLSPLRGLPIEDLVMHGCLISDYSPLLDLPNLRRLQFDKKGLRLASLRTHPKLEQISVGFSEAYRPVAEVWAEYDAEQAAGKK